MTETKTVLLIGRSGRGKSTLANVLLNKNNNFEEVFKESAGSASETKKVQFGEFDDLEKEKLNKLLDKLNQEERNKFGQGNLDKEDLHILRKILYDHIQNKKETKYCVIDTPGIGDTKMSDNEVLDIIAEAVYRAKDGINQVFFVISGRFDQYEMATYNLLRTIIFDKEITKYTTITRTRFESFKSKKKCDADINLMIKEAEKKKAELEKKMVNNKKKIESLFSDSDEYKTSLVEIEWLKKELTVTNLAEIINSCQGKIIHVDNPSINIDSADDEDEEERQEKEKKVISRKETRNKSRKKLLEHLRSSCLETYNPPNLVKLSAEITEVYFEYLKKKEELKEELSKIKNNENISLQNNETEPSIVSEEKVRTEDDSENIFSESSKVKPIGEKESAKDKQALIIEDGDSLAIGERTKFLESKKAQLKKEIAEKERIIRQKVLKHIFNNYEGINNELGGNIFLENFTEDNNDWEVINPAFNDKKLVLEWKSNGFDYQQVQKWVTALGNSFQPTNDAPFCVWLRDDKKLIVERIKELSHVYYIIQLRKEYVNWLEQETALLNQHNQKLNWKENGDAQEWLDKNYPLKERNKIKELDISHKNLTGFLLIKDWPRLEKLNCYKNKLTSLCISNCKNLTALSCRDNKLTNLDVSSCSGLTWLSCYGNQLTKLDLNNCSGLIELYCQNNQLTELDLSNFSSLTEFDCSYNQLIKLELSNCKNLTELYCQNNQLTNLTKQLRDYAKRDEYKKVYYDYQAWLKDQLQLINSVQVSPK